MLDEKTPEELWESQDPRITMPIAGLMSDAVAYGLPNISYIKPSRYYVGTSSGRAYRRCQRKWAFNSSYRLGLEHEGTTPNINFWFGSAIHYAMEDYFGWNRHGDPRRAFKAYYDAFELEDRPSGASEHYDLGIGMLNYFLEWYPKHNAMCGFETAWFKYPVEGETTWQLAEPFSSGAFPGTEIEICLDLGVRMIVDATTGKPVGELIYNSATNRLKIVNKSGWAANFAGDCVTTETLEIAVSAWNDFDTIYHMPGEFRGTYAVRVQPICFHGTCDKICKDKMGRLWILDYKTAKSADTDKLDTDDQISRYLWAAEQYLGLPMYGFVYLQLTKEIPKQPRILNGGDISVDKKQKTTYQLYAQALIAKYGDLNMAPSKNLECLNVLASKETAEGDGFIRWDMITRSDAQKCSTYYNVLAEAKKWMNSDEFMIPTPTRDCIWDCPYRDACLALENRDFSSFEMAIANFLVRGQERSDKEETWKNKIQYPENPTIPVTAEELRLDPEVEFNIILPKEEE